MTFVITSRSLFELSVFTRVLLKEGHTVIFCTNQSEIIDMIGAGKIDAMIGDDKDLASVRELIARFPLLNTAILSDAPHEEFHETTEGLGVFMQIPKLPEKSHALEFEEKLRHILCLTAK